MSEPSPGLVAFLCGLFGAALVVGSVRSLLYGGVRLRRYEASLSEAWPIVAVLGVLGVALVVGAAVVWKRQG